MKTRIAACGVAALLALAAQAQPTAPPVVETVRVPAGCYMMGSESGEKHEKPVHKECIAEFEIGKFEVTQGQWKALMGDNPSKFNGDDTRPVDNVSWDGAQEFIKRLNAQAPGGWRLPTEAEWEYACRSGGKEEDYAGGSANDLRDLAWYNKEDAGNMTHPVGTKKPNGLGAHDMSGNVWEWVQDTFTTPYGGDTKETKRVMRGGSWDGKVRYVRCAIRNRQYPDYHDYRAGFRLARDVKR